MSGERWNGGNIKNEMFNILFEFNYFTQNTGTNKFNLLRQLYLGVNCTRLNYEDPPSTNVAIAATEALRAIQG